MGANVIMRIKRLIKTLLFLSRINWFLSKWINRAIILVFHRVAEPTIGLLDHRTGCVAPDIFADELLYLQSLEYNFVALDDLVHRLRTGNLGKMAVVTFDDGFKDLYVNAFPILKNEGIPFTLFLISAIVDSIELNWLHKIYFSLDRVDAECRLPLTKQYLGNFYVGESLDELFNDALRNNTKISLQEVSSSLSRVLGLTPEDEVHLGSRLYLSVGELREMVQYGLRIENHTCHHWPFTALNPTETDEEIRLVQDFVIHNFRQSPRFLCVPFGIFNNEAIVDLMAKFAFIGVCTSEEGLVGPSTKRQELPRVIPPNDLIDFAYMLTYLFLMELKTKLIDYILGFSRIHWFLKDKTADLNKKEL